MEKLFFAPFELILNQILTRDPNFAIFLEQHKNKVIRINFIYIYILENGLYFSLEMHKYNLQQAIPNLTIKFPFTKSIIIFIETIKDKIDYQKLNIHGDLDLAQDFINLLRNYDAFYLNKIATVFGDICAYAADCIKQNVNDVFTDKAYDLKEMLTMYLEDELLVVATKDEVLEFNLSVDALRLAVDRLEAKITKLKLDANH